MTVPVGFLYGVARDRLARGGVARLAVELERLGPGRLGDALRELLHDPTLVLAYRRPDGDGYVTSRATRSSCRRPDPGLTVIEPVAAIVHDPALHAEPELLASALATARLALENERLQAELAARLQELKCLACPRPRGRRSRSGGGSSATCTTARSSGSSRSRCAAAGAGAAARGVRRGARAARRRQRASSRTRSRSCASSRAASIPPC